MPEHHVREIEKVVEKLGSLKALIGMSSMDDSEWENVSSILDEFSFRLRTSADGIRESLGAAENRTLTREKGTVRSWL